MQSKLFVKIIYVICIPLLSFFLFFHPTYEEMSCDSNYECKIIHSYFNIFKFNTFIKLNKNSKISYKIKDIGIPRKTGPQLNLSYDNELPFIYYFDYSPDVPFSYNNDLEDYNFHDFKLEKQKFNDYVNNPSIGYQVSPKEIKLHSWLMWTWLVLSIGLIVFVFKLRNYN